MYEVLGKLLVFWYSVFSMHLSTLPICFTLFILYTLEDRQEGNQQMEGTSPDEEIETAESHRNTHAHFKKATEFKQYQDLYLLNVHPCLTKEDELRQMLEGPSLSGKTTQVALDLERLEGFHSRVKSEVQIIESSLDWTNISSLNDALKVFQVALQETERIVEQGNLGRYNLIVFGILVPVPNIKNVGLHKGSPGENPYI